MSERPSNYSDTDEVLAAELALRVKFQAKVEQGDLAKVRVTFYRGELERIIEVLLGGQTKPSPDVAKRGKAIASILVNNVLCGHIPMAAQEDAIKTLAKFLRETNLKIEVHK